MLAFAIIYLIWGSTFLAMRFALAQVPASLVISVRCIGGAAPLLVWARLFGNRAAPVDWLGAVLAGFLFFVTGQGLLAYGLRFVPSGASAVFLATIPLWIVILGVIIDRAAPPWLTLVGCAVGLAGVALLAFTRLEGGLERFHPLATVALLASSVSWAVGTEFSRRRRVAEDPVARTGRQLLTGGVILLIASALTGNLAGWTPATVSPSGYGAVVYLIVCGTVLGFGAYSWLLRKVRPSIVSTYAFVNPIVALFLGWALAGEPITPMLLLASGIVLAAVAMVVLSGLRAED